MIEGVKTITLRQIPDERGAILHMLRSDAPDFTKFGECYFSEVFPNAVKAWKCHRQQSQNLSVPVGRIRLVIYDDRVDSPTRNRLLVAELGRPDRYVRMRIGPGLWYGFKGLGPGPALIVNCPDLPHDPDECDNLPSDSSRIPHRWND